jgi:hypothetical protein
LNVIKIFPVSHNLLHPFILFHLRASAFTFAYPGTLASHPSLTSRNPPSSSSLTSNQNDS